MSDNHKSYHKEDWANQGWRQMEVILDEEMPTKRKKRRLFLWVFLLLGIGFSVLRMYDSTLNTTERPQHAVSGIDRIKKDSVQVINQNTVVVNHQNKVHPKVELEPKRSSAISESFVNKDHTKQQSIVEHTVKSSLSGISSLSETKNTQVKSTSSNPSISKSVSSFISDDSTNTKVIVRPIKLPLKQDNVLEKKSTKPVLNSLKKPIAKEKRVLQLVEPIVATIDYTNIDEPRNAVEIHTLQPKKINRNASKWTYQAQVGLVYRAHNFAGFTVGGNIAYQFTNRWRISSGLWYDALYGNLNYQHSFEKNTDEVSSPLIDVEQPLSFNEIVDSLYGTPKWHHSLILPLELKYRIARLELSGGLGLQYAFNKYDVSQLESNTIESGSFSNEVLSYKEQHVTWNIMGLVGASYFINDKWSLNANAGLGLGRAKFSSSDGDAVKLAPLNRYSVGIVRHF